MTKNKTDRDLYLLHSGLDLLNKFYMLVRTSRLYEPNNLLFVHQLRDFLQTLDEILRREKIARFLLRATTLLFNGVKLKFSHTNYYLFRFIYDEFTPRQIASLAFYPGVKEKEIVDFILAFKPESDSKTTASASPAAEEAEAKSNLLSREFPHIKVEKRVAESLSEKKKSTARVYFLGLTHLKEYLTQKKDLDTKNLLTTRRMIQTLFDHIVENESFIYGLTSIKNHDEYTLNHSINVCVLALALGRRLGLERKELVELGISAFFHDVGKLDIPLEILNKPGKLDENERRVIETHPYKGVQKLLQFPHLKGLPLQALHVAMEHHCREDDRGYPRYRGKKTISLFSKIVKIVDYYDAITTPRPYRKKAFSPAEAINLMMEKAGEEFDPTLLKVFAAMMTACPVGTLVLLSTGEIGLVYETKTEPAQYLRPRVKLITDSQGQKIDGPIVDLAAKDATGQHYLRSIVKVLDPDKYGIKVSDYFMAEAQ
ncbi:MAG: HD domain-containing protein [Candidatus Aminicenantes bacterium]|nr:HD domain-containing protein [Candidatus Aminicenantes bacterium]